MIEDPEVPDEDAPAPRPVSPSKAAANGAAAAAAAPEDNVRVAFQIVPAAAVVPPQSAGWQVAVAGLLLLLFLASATQLSLVANITKLPKVRGRARGGRGDGVGWHGKLPATAARRLCLWLCQSPACRHRKPLAGKHNS